MLLQLLLILFIIVSCKYNYEMLQFNQITDLKDIHKSNKVHILSELQQKNPIVVHNLLPTYESLKQITLASIVQNNPGYIAKDGSKLISLDRLLTTDQMFIHNNY